MSDHKHLVQVRTSLNGRFSYAIACLEALASVCTACFDSPMSKVTTIHSSNSKENAPAERVGHVKRRGRTM
jgi:hypothetical protein